MRTLDGLRAPYWPTVRVEIGARFSIIPVRVEVMAVKSAIKYPCGDCVMSSGSPFADEARSSGTTCGSLPRCTTVVFLPMTPEYIAKYTASRFAG